jgi:O-antigen ligase
MVFLVRNRMSELALLLMVCLAPWAFGSVEAWAELGLYAGIGLLAVLGFGQRFGPRRAGILVRVPSVALGGLVLLAVFQSMPVGCRVLPWLAPSSAAIRADLLPQQPEQLGLAPSSAALFPASTLSVDPDSSVQTAARLAAAWLLLLSVLGMKADPPALERFATVVVFNAALLALFSIIQALTWNGQIYWVRPVMVASGWSAGGPFLSHNHLAAYLNMGLGLAVGLLLCGDWRDILRRDSSKLWTAYATVIIAVGVITSNSRSGFLGLLAGTFLLALVLRSRLLKMGFGLPVVLVMIGVFLVLLGGPSSFVARLATILDFGDEGYQARVEVWRGALRAWWTRPVWGAGLGTFPTAVIPFLTRNRTVFFARAENEYVDLLVEAGAVGLLMALAFIVGVAGLARRAYVGARSDRERGLILGTGFGLVALLVQSSADFGPHIPAVGVMAVVLCGVIARMGRTALAKESRGQIDLPCAVPAAQLNPHQTIEDGNARRPRSPSRRDAVAAVTSVGARTGRNRWMAPELRWLGSVLLAEILVVHGIRDATIEYKLAAVGLPLPGTHMPTAGTLETAIWGLDDWRDALQDAVRRRPSWAEGYVRLGLVHLGLYRKKAKEWLEDSAIDPKAIDRMAEPLWLLGAMYDDQAATPIPSFGTDILRFEPIRFHLVPAVTCFLEARRCCLFLPLPHAELASLHYLMMNGDTVSTYATRALALSGNDGFLLAFLAQVAVQAGDRNLAARCWRRKLEADPSSWPEVADDAVLVLSAEELLRSVTTDGRMTIRFAERLYGGSDQRLKRDRFFQAAIGRLALDRDITAAERLFFEAQASAGLDLSKQACERIESALALQPSQSEWREAYIDWLLRWGRPDEAHRQALIGRFFSPDSPGIRAAVDSSAEALARGGGGPQSRSD